MDYYCCFEILWLLPIGFDSASCDEAHRLFDGMADRDRVAILLVSSRTKVRVSIEADMVAAA